MEQPILTVAVDLDPRISLALQQNGVPVVRLLRVTNTGSARIDALVVRLRLDPDVGSAWVARIASIDAGATFNLEHVDLALSAERLVSQVEREAGHLFVEVDGPHGPVHRSSVPIEVLAYNEWSGAGSLPELIAAFVLPNHPALPPVVSDAARRLGAGTGDPSLDGYQSRDPGRALAIVHAVYDALAAVGVTYVNPPASFEKQGQKVRTPEQVLGERLGTCIDLTVLLAALLEQVGLHPIVVLIRGHAFPGVWLGASALPSPVLFDPLALVKRIELGELAVFDATSATQGAPFARAVSAAARHLDDPDAFRYAVDVKAAREHRILPLPMRSADGRWHLVSQPRAAPVEAPQATLPAEAPTRREAPATRLDRWKRRLLDLTLRNRLLHFVETKTTLPLLHPGLARLEDALQSGDWFDLTGPPEVLGERDPRDPELLAALTGGDVVREILGASLDRRMLHVGLGADELAKRGIELYRTARTSLEEAGAITLHVAVGFLEWFETGSSTAPRRAPLLLLPAELSRGSVREPVQLRLADEDAMVNVTLLQKLESEFGLPIGGLDELPEDDAGLDIERILQKFRMLVRDVPRWRVVDACHVGIFSFTKFLMWRDLQSRTAAVLANPVARRVIEGSTEPFPLAAPFPDPLRLDQDRPAPLDLSVVDADGSQLCAVYAAVDGNSFVLQGPPGTGKSQTITNLVSNLLGQGKTVLFVSEKRAALEVVHRRVTQVGLGPFCLELHSDKASKSFVMQQLREPLELAVAPHDAWLRHTGRLQDERLALDAVVGRLHAPGPFGWSIQRATARVIGLHDTPRVALTGTSTLDEDGFDAMLRAVDELAAAAVEVGVPERHAFAASRATAWDPKTAREVAEAIDRLVVATDALSRAVHGATTALGLPPLHERADAIARLVRVAELLPDTPGPPEAALVGPAWRAHRELLTATLQAGRERAAVWADLAERYTERLLALPIAPLRASYEKWADAFVPVACLFLYTARQTMARVAVSGRASADRAVRDDLHQAARVVALDAEIARSGDVVASLLGAPGPAPDWERLTAAATFVDAFRAAVLDLTDGPHLRGDVAERDRARADLVRLASAGAERVGPGRPTAVALQALRDGHAAFQSARHDVASRLALDEPAAWGPDPALADVAAQARAWQAALPSLRAWTLWVARAAAAADLGLAPLVQAHRAGRIGPDRLRDAAIRGVLEAWLEDRFAADPALRAFRGADHQQRIARFRQLDTQALALARHEVRARVAARLPDPGAMGEMEVVRRELKKKRRHLPVRRLFREIPHVLQRLKPFVLMSPLSVAQYLDPELGGFDLVVFDEASQIPPWDAVGAIARGRQVVVVGDSRQLPPTTFFEAGDDELSTDEEDLESILDECVASGLPVRRLRWHYRSRHEGLIAFSNHHYYDNGLLTFPSAHDDPARLGVRLRPVEGYYDKGRSRTNPAEARAVTDAVVAHLTDPARSGKSLGVVTFSRAQQRLVEDLLDEARRARPEIERFFSDDVAEPLFVKNLENVQGDERDVMLFSICYAPDRAGVMSMNFGPLNREGGERRLNVAITRARELLVVFATVRPDQIDLARTQAVGVRHLKTFLDYARRGTAAIDEAVALDPAADFESPFEQRVAERLVAAGWTVHRQVGCSGYRIDLAVADPERPGAWLLGIECDGATYHASRTARDRDRLRQAVLEGLGWRLVRIWSTDWWQDPDRELARVIAALEQARQAPRPESAVPVVPVWTEPAPAPPVAAPRWPADASAWAAPVWPGLGTPEDFERASERRRIGERVAEIVAALGPIHQDVVARLVGDAYGLARTSKRVRERVGEAWGALPAGERPVRQGEHLWPPGSDPAGWRGFRYAGDAGRAAEHLAVEEVANAAAWVVERAVAIGRDELARETAAVFGISRLGRVVHEAMDAGIARLVRDGRAEEAGGLIRSARSAGGA